MERTPSRTPREKAGFLVLLTFSWIHNVLKLGSKQPLEEKHLFPVEISNQAERLVADLESEWLAEKRASEQNRTKPRLWRAMMRVIPYREYVTVVLIRIFYSLASNSLPLILWFFLRSISAASSTSYSTTLAFVTGIALTSIVRMFCNSHWVFKTEVMAIRLKVAAIGFVYKKLLSVNRRAIENVMPGNIINIVSNDAKAIELLGLPLLAVLFSPLDIAISFAIVWIVASWQGLIGTSFLAVVFAYGSVAAKKAGQLRRNAAELIDKRLQLIEEIIKGIRAMKMYAWEWNFRAVVARIRRKEISFIRFRGFIISSIYALFFTSSAIAGLISVTALVLTGISLTPVRVFALLSALANIKLNVTLFIADSLRFIADAKTACNRMQQFLESEPIDSESTNQKQHPQKIKVYFKKRKYNHHSVRIESFRSSKPVLINARKLGGTPQHTPFQIVLECVSCSWDQLLERTTLKNVSLRATSGQLVGVTGPVGSGKTTLLMSILEELPVSAGQTSCIGKIAYVSQTPWVFSGTMRENITFGKTFVEHKYLEIIQACDLTVDISRFPKGDLTEIGQRGVILSGGQRARVSLARAIYSDSDIYLLDDPFSAVDAKVGKHLFERCIKEFLDRRIRILVTHQLQFLKETDYVIKLENGLVVYEGTYDGMERERKVRGTENQVSEKGQDQVQHYGEDEYGYETFKSLNVENKNERIDLEEEDEDRMVGTVKWWVYWKYLRAALPTGSIVALAVFFVVIQFSWIAPYWWLSRMTEMPFEQQKESINLVVFGSIALVSLLLTIASSFCFYLAALKASENLHDQMTTTVMKAPVLFFDTNPVGRILNRFSKDIGCMDDLLPGQFLFAVKLLLYFFGATILSAVANVWLVITCAPLTLLFLYLTKYYLKSAREIRRLDSMTCSPVYSCIADTVAGLEVIRSSEMENSFLRRLYSYIDQNTSASIMLKASTRWLAIRGDTLSIFLLTSVSAGALFATQSPALAGMSLAFVIESLEVGQYAIRMTSEAESHMTSVERVLNYTNIESEPGYSTETVPDESWPTVGSLTLRELYLAYFKDAPAVLKSISINVAAKEKVGVVGRTGAGKSSLVAALFRMPEPDGQVIIDGVNIKDLNLQASRRSMAVITQDPVLFSGSLRKNLDPFSLYQDNDLWRALEDVQLKTLVQLLPNQLEYKLRESGNNFSVGERQLVCLARALLQRSKIIILDEATANVDFKTDRLIQEVIRSRFKDCTVVTIAHRLNTIMDYDKVLVMEQGRVVEFDKPEVLLQNKNGFFTRLVRTQGGHEA